MISIDGVSYYTAAEAARYLCINRCMFYNNVKEKLYAYRIGARKRLLYKQSDLEPFRAVELVKAS